MVGIPKRIAKQWILRHEKDELDEYKISIFLKLQYELRNYEVTPKICFYSSCAFKNEEDSP